MHSFWKFFLKQTQKAELWFNAFFRSLDDTILSNLNIDIPDHGIGNEISDNFLSSRTFQNSQNIGFGSISRDFLEFQSDHCLKPVFDQIVKSINSEYKMETDEKTFHMIKIKA